MEIVINKGDGKDGENRENGNNRGGRTSQRLALPHREGKSQEGVQAGNSRRKVVWKPV